MGLLARGITALEVEFLGQGDDTYREWGGDLLGTTTDLGAPAILNYLFLKKL